MVEYTIQSGDTLGGISALYFGEAKFYKNLAQFNGIKDSNKISVGQVLNIPINGFYSFDDIKEEVIDGVKTYTAIVSKGSGESMGEDSAVYYAPGRDEYFIVEDPDFDSFEKEVNTIDNLAVEINEFRVSNQNTKITEATAKSAKQLEEKVTKKFKDLIKNPDNAIQELLLIKGNKRVGKLSRRVYIRPYKTKNGSIKGHFRKNNDTTVQKHLNKWLKKETAKGNTDGGMNKKLKAMIWQSDQLDKKWPWEFKTQKAEGESDTPVGYFSGSAEAQFFRFVAGVKAEAEFDLTEMKLKLAGSAKASYSLAEGTVTGQWSLPDKDGFDIYAHLKLSKNARSVIKSGYECRFRLTIKAEGKAFVGGSLATTIGLPCIDLSSTDQLDKEIAMGIKGNIFAGASVEGKIAVCVEWDEQSVQGEQSFASLAGVSAVASGNAGAGIGGKFEIEYKDGKFHFECGAMATLGLGGKAGLGFELGIDETVELFAHLFNSVNFHRIDCFAPLTFEVLANAAFAQFIVAEKLTDAILDKTKDFFGWLDKEKRPNDGYQNTKNNISATLTNSKKLKTLFPESLGRLLITIMEVPEEQDFEDIITVLNSANGNQSKLKSILRSVGNISFSTKASVDKGDVLNEGIGKLFEFGNRLENYNKFKTQLLGILNDNKIKIN